MRPRLYAAEISRAALRLEARRSASMRPRLYAAEIPRIISLYANGMVLQ